MSCISIRQILWPFRDHSNDDDDDDVRQGTMSYRHVITLGGSTGIGVRTLMQQVYIHDFELS